VKKILVAIDLSQVTDDVIRHARDLAQAYSAELTLIHVAEPEPAFVGFSVGPQSVREDVAQELCADHRRIQELAEQLRHQGVAARALLVQGPTVKTIMDEAADLDADCIVLGSHGHSAVYQALLGSVTRGVVRRARCAVFIVPAPGAEARANTADEAEAAEAIDESNIDDA